MVQLALDTLVTRYVEPPDSTALLSGAWRGARGVAEQAGVLVGDSLDPSFADSQAPVRDTFDHAFRSLITRSEGRVTAEALAGAAIEGMAKSLHDPHTRYLSPERWEQLQASHAGAAERSGFGFTPGFDREGGFVAQVLPESPAARAGLRQGDGIISVNNSPFSSRGQPLPADGAIRLRIERDSDQVEIELVSERVRQPALSTRLLPGGVAYVRLANFPDPSSRQRNGETFLTALDAALGGLAVQQPRGWILDLRNNGGGYAVTASHLTGRFGLTGVLFSVRTRTGQTQRLLAQGQSMIGDRRLVVLVNHSSISAAEVTAGALQQAGIARVIGTRTAGSVSLADTLPLYRAGLQVTVARLLVGPEASALDGVGVMPDEVVTFAQTRAQAKDGLDSQIIAALSYLESRQAGYRPD